MCCFTDCLLLLLLLSLDYGCTSYNGQDNEYKTIKGTIGKPLDLPYNITNQTHWLKKFIDKGRTKILQYDPKNQPVSAENQFTFNAKKMEFKILKVRREHEGHYIIIEDGPTEFDIAKFHIKVYEPITNVSIRQTENPMNDSCLITLNCTTLGGDDVMYNWTRNQEYLQHNSSILEITLTPNSANISYTCRATNPVSQGFASIIPLESRCNINPEERQDIIIISVGAILLVVLMLILLTVMYIYRPKEKGSFSLDPQRSYPVPEPHPEPEPAQREITTIYSTVQKGSFSLDPQRPHQVPEQLPEPEPVLKEITSIYSTVQKAQAPVCSPTAEQCTIYELAGPVGSHTHQTAVP
ncbi:SLAM family member 9-like [Xenopus laevis]|uniref:Ig-like domain-containing protein n=2 Tax=Xenopus laevis TaxID=8355 RepID=A0A974C9Y3_XENLA|nr:SLAM family member 9-like [Xenopus laevis]OCT69247.1 hypothetical protein XELAEV_18040558mg [Xenopus laevis]